MLRFLLVFLCISVSWAQTGSLTGSITSENGVPVSDVSVYIKTLGKGTYTDQDGIYRIKNIKPGTYEIIASFVGFETMSQTFTIAAGEEKTLNLQLLASSEELTEVLLVARKNNPNERVINTVSRLPVKVKYQTQAITVLDNTLLTEQQLTNLDEAINYAPGFNLESTRGNQFPSIRVRGSSATLLVNGLRIESSTREGDGNFDFNSIDNIQFINGASSIGLGNASVGGSINTVTKKAEFEKGGYAFGSVGSFGRSYNGLDYQTLTTSEKVGFRLTSSWNVGETFREGVDYEAITFAPSLGWKISEKDLLNVDYIFNNDVRSQDVGQLRIDSLLLASGGTFIDQPFQPAANQSIREDYIGFNDDFQKQLSHSVFLNYTRELSDKIQFGVNGGLYTKDRTSRGINTRRAYRDTDRDGITDTFVRSSVFQETGATSASARADLVGKDLKLGKISHSFQLSADTYNNRNFAKGNGAESRDPGPEIDRIDLLNPVFNSDITQLSEEAQQAYYAELLNTNNIAHRTINGITLQEQLKLSPKLRLTAGLRYSWGNSFSELEENYNTDSLQRSKSDIIDFDGFSPNFGVFYDLNPNVLFYGTYTNTFDETSISPNRVDAEGSILGNELFEQFETGIRTTFFQNKFGANLVFYRIFNNNVATRAVDFNNEPLTSPGAVSAVNPDGEYFVAVGEQRRQGMELSLQGQVVSGLRLYGTYSFYEFFQRDNEVTEAIINTSDYNPKHSASIIANYEVQQGFAKGVKIGGGAVYTGDRTVSTRGRNSFTFINEAFTTYSLTFGYTHKNISIDGRIMNLTNELAYNYFGTTFINPISPRSIDVKLTYKL